MSPQTVETLTYAAVAVMAVYIGYFIGEFFKAPWQSRSPVVIVMSIGITLVVLLTVITIAIAEVWT